MKKTKKEMINPAVAALPLCRQTFRSKVTKHWQFYLIVALPILFFLVFRYFPMYGILLAFKNRYSVSKGIWNSAWAQPYGLGQFIKFLSNPSALRTMWNTFSISMYALFASIPLAVIMAICLNECRSQKWKKAVQLVTYAPYFISTVVMVAILLQFLDPSMGVFNGLRRLLGLKTINYMGEPKLFKHIYVWSALWQNTGYNAIIYLAALTGINPELYEAARVDGVNKWQKIWHVDLPCIRSTIIIMFIMNMGYVMSLGFEKVFLMQNALNLETSEIMSTYVYKMGLLSSDFAYSTAIDLLNSVINIILILTFNKLTKLVSDEGGIW